MNANGSSRGFGSEFVEHPIEDGLLSIFSNPLSSREAARVSWSEPAFHLAPIRCSNRLIGGWDVDGT